MPRLIGIDVPGAGQGFLSVKLMPVDCMFKKMVSRLGLVVIALTKSGEGLAWKSLAKDSIKQLFIKYYNWLCVIWGRLMKAKIRNEMTRG